MARKKTNVGITVSAKDKTAGAFKSVQKNLQILTAINVAQVFGQATRAIGDAVNRMTEFAGEADRVAKAARRVGLSAASMSQLGFAAEQSGNSVAEMQTAMTALTRRAAAMPKTFEKWGIAVKDANGTIKNSDVLLDEVADRMLSLGSAAERSAMAQDLMAEAGRKLVPMLAGGSAQLKAFRAEADRLGATITDAEAKLSEDFNDAVNRARVSLAGAGRTIATEFLPYAASIAEVTSGLASQIGQWVRANRELISSGIDTFLTNLAEYVIPAMLTGVNMLQMAFNGLQIIIGAVKTAMQSQVVVFVEAMNTMVNAGVRAIGVFSDTQADRLRNSPLIQGLEILRQSSRDTLSQFINEMKEDAKDVERNAEAIGDIAQAAALKIRDIQGAVQSARADAGASFGLPAQAGGASFVVQNAGERTGNAGVAVASGMSQAARENRAALDREFDRLKRRASLEERMLQSQRQLVQKQQEMVNQISGPLTGAISGMVFQGRSATDALRGLAQIIFNRLLSGALNTLLSAIIPIPGFSKGGLVRGPEGKDRVPAFLTAGEYVLPKNVVDSIRGGKQPSAVGLFSDGGLATVGGGAQSMTVNINSITPPDSASIRGSIATGLLPVLDRVERNRIAYSSRRYAGART